MLVQFIVFMFCNLTFVYCQVNYFRNSVRCLTIGKGVLKQALGTNLQRSPDVYDFCRRRLLLSILDAALNFSLP